jgi:hypothetical protein
MVNDVRGKSKVLSQDEHCSGKEDEALGVIKIVALRGPIEEFPVEILFTANEIDWDLRSQLALVDVSADDLPSEGHFNLLSKILKGEA